MSRWSEAWQDIKCLFGAHFLVVVSSKTRPQQPQIVVSKGYCGNCESVYQTERGWMKSGALKTKMRTERWHQERRSR